MGTTGYILGIDTSNYKTSVAVVDDRSNIICDFREFLKVKQGERGLRQSDALFQHIKMLPELMKKVRETFFGELIAVAYSSRPRPVDGSYMPVFLAGEGFARAIAYAANIPSFAFSHQEGHLEAVKTYSSLRESSEFLFCHFSGGTCELLDVNENSRGFYEISQVGGSYDISYGQVIDRAGVMMGYEFPAGEILDKIAIKSSNGTALLTAVKVSGGYLNLSGIDTQIKNTFKEKFQRSINENLYEVSIGEFIHEIFEKLSDSMVSMLLQCSEKTGKKDIIMAGGVSSSRFIRHRICALMQGSGLNIIFSDNGLAQDNAVGTALLGGKAIWG